MAEEDYDDQPIHVNFTDVEPRPTFYLLPAGVNLIVEIEDYEEEISESTKNPGARMINWRFTVESAEDGEEEITARVRNPEDNKPSVQTIKVAGRKLFDRMVFVEEMYGRVMEFMDAMGYATDGDVKLWPSKLVGERLMVRVGVQPRKKNKETGEWYKPRNRIDKFLPLPETPAPVAAKAPVAAEQASAKAKAKDTKQDAEAKV
jgi:hypothetical protein